ncbi:hypothetical protein [Trueperella abortisuis]|uniref:DUF4276 family protein n=1 Tax=Trueperella abortisuis TaxID=445930 RepID=A0ABT9PHC0_9ACTO|nr:hypothetical protein [Trueperella abortisuis]MDP9832102.1 hypothetical protein [Trueperella abortisuis]
MTVQVHLVYEGASDLPFLMRLVEHVGAHVGGHYRQGGASNLDRKIDGYRRAASWQNADLWLIVRDSDGDCAVEIRDRLLGGPCPPNFLLRIAVPMMEEWMLADVEGAASFFRLPLNVLHNAQQSVHPKKELLRAVAHFGTKTMKQRLVRDGDRPGPEFQSVYGEFSQVWDIDNAMKNSESLRRAHDALRRALFLS